MSVRVGWLLGLLGAAFAVVAFACDSAYSTSASGDGGTDASAEGGGDAGAPPAMDAGSPDATTDASTDAGADACATFQITSAADTYLVDDGNHCNAFQTFGISTTLHAQMTAPAEVVLVRFALTQAQLSFLQVATATISFAGAGCDGGLCAGKVVSMRSDWDEGMNDSKGADECRRAFPSDSWGDGGNINASIAAPDDYDPGLAAKMILTSGTWTSEPFPASTIGQRALSPGGDAGASVSVLFALTSTGELAVRSREAKAAGATLTLSRCE